MTRFTTVAMGMLLTAATAFGQVAAVKPNNSTVVYFVRHAEVNPLDATLPLSTEGKVRAGVFAHTVSGVNFTHVFSSHTTRARQMVEPVAEQRRLSVRQFPEPGTQVDGALVSDASPSRIAIAPLVQALRELPAGSSALVGVNSDNVFAILNGLGVPAATAERPCALGSTCVPCLTNTCASRTFDQLWILIVDPASSPKLIELRYGSVVNN